MITDAEKINQQALASYYLAIFVIRYISAKILSCNFFIYI